jgi:hypothetical protein
MSFDLRIVSNDLVINSDGSLQTVRNNEKLIQDILKAILTPLGSNKFFKWYGCLIAERTIGQILDATLTEIEVKRSVQDTLTNLIALQKAQAKTQYVSAGESIAAIREISVLRNKSDPRQYEVYVSVLTRKLTIAETTFTLRV